MHQRSFGGMRHPLTQSLAENRPSIFVNPHSYLLFREPSTPGVSGLAWFSQQPYAPQILVV